MVLDPNSPLHPDYKPPLVRQTSSEDDFEAAFSLADIKARDVLMQTTPPHSELESLRLQQSGGKTSESNQPIERAVRRVASRSGVISSSSDEKIAQPVKRAESRTEAKAAAGSESESDALAFLATEPM